MTTKNQIRAWLEEGQKAGAKFVVIVCDTYDHEDYPCYCTTVEQAHEKVKNPGQMQQVMEVYSLTGKHTIEAQLAEGRAFHYD